MREGPDDILLDYYQGSYGPTIRFDIQETTALSELKGLFMTLPESAPRTRDLLQQRRRRTNSMGTDPLNRVTSYTSSCRTAHPIVPRGRLGRTVRQGHQALSRGSGAVSS